MKLIKSSYQVLTYINGFDILESIELAGRTCYKSENKISRDSCIAFVKMIINNGHLSVIEHESITVKFIFDRGVSHEIVRHRIASFSHESTRYCNYSSKKHKGEIKCIDISEHLTNKLSFDIWFDLIVASEIAYLRLIELGEKPEIARSVLPNSLKTEIIVTANLREWRLILSQRASKFAHPQMKEVMLPLLKELKSSIPVIFDDIIF